MMIVLHYINVNKTSWAYIIIHVEWIEGFILFLMNELCLFQNNKRPLELFYQFELKPADES